MEYTINELTLNQEHFFTRLKNYIDKPIYFYGSIQRKDYLPGYSDIDINIFTDNESSTIQALCNFLNLPKSNFRKILYRLNNKIVTGYKTKYIDTENNISEIEISVYNEKYKEDVLNDHMSVFDLSPIKLFVLYIQCTSSPRGLHCIV